MTLINISPNLAVAGTRAVAGVFLLLVLLLIASMLLLLSMYMLLLHGTHDFAGVSYLLLAL